MEITYASSSLADLVSPATRTPATSRPVKVIPFQHPYGDGGDTTPSSSSSSSTTSFSKWRMKVKQMKTVDWIDFLLPCSRWIRIYNWRENLQPDVIAGVTVGIMLVPQSMSYAKLAGLQPIYGLYTGLVPVFVYSIFGSSRQLAVGPVALVSLLVSNVLGNVDSSTELYTELAILLSLMVGILECTMGLLRLGWLIRFISRSVISGFTTASAFVIALSQAKYFLGYDVDRSSQIIPLAKSIISGADQFQWPPFLMGSFILAIILVMKHLGKTRKKLRFLRAGGPLTAVVLGTAFVKIFHPSSITLVGDIPQGLPPFSIPKDFSHVKSLIPTSFLITGVAILESVGIAKALAAKNGYELDSNQELFGLGVANICGSFFSAYPSTGSFSRSAVNHESGAKTGLSGIIMGIIMACALLFMTPLFEYIPQCALAAIVISAVIGLVDYDEALFLWRVDKKDFFLWSVTSATTLFLGIEIGVLVGVGFSLAFVIHESANPHIAVLGRLPGTTVYRNIQQYPEAYTYNGIVIVRIDAPIYFANTSYIKDRLREYEIVVDQSSKRGPEVERIYFVILEMAPVTYVDSSAVQALKELYQEYNSRDIQIAIANPNKEVLLTLAKSGFIEQVGKEWCFVRVHDAVQVCLQHVPNPNNTPKIPHSSTDKSSSFLERLGTRRKEDLLTSEMESGERVSTFETDPLDYHSIVKALEGCYGLFYSFEPPSDQPTYDESMAEMEVRAAHNVLEACAQVDTIDKVVFTSSATAVIWRDTTESTPSSCDVDERNWSNVNFCKKFKLWHGLSKTLAEKTAWALAMDRGLSMVSVNAGLLLSPDLTITHPYLKGAAEMYEDGVFVTVDLQFLVYSHICVYEDVSAYGRYLCFNHVINCNEDAVKLAQILLPPDVSSLPPSMTVGESRMVEQRISNKKINKLLVDFDSEAPILNE